LERDVFKGKGEGIEEWSVGLKVGRKTFGTIFVSIKAGKCV